MRLYCAAIYICYIGMLHTTVVGSIYFHTPSTITYMLCIMHYVLCAMCDALCVCVLRVCVIYYMHMCVCGLCVWIMYVKRIYIEYAVVYYNTSTACL